MAVPTAFKRGMRSPFRSASLMILASAALLGACGGPPAEEATTTLTVEHAGFRLTVPDGWSAEATNNVEGPLQIVAYLSSLPLELECTGEGMTRHCRTPSSLADGSLLVTWLATFCAGSSCTPPAGQPILVGGREASLVSDAVVCERFKPTEAETYFVAVTPQRLDAIAVCKRDAPDSADAALRDMLEHIDWLAP
jgi:hypothetical protein